MTPTCANINPLSGCSSCSRPTNRRPASGGLAVSGRRLHLPLDAERKIVTESTLFHRFGRLHDLTPALIFLASDASSYLIESIKVDSVGERCIWSFVVAIGNQTVDQGAASCNEADPINVAYPQSATLTIGVTSLDSDLFKTQSLTIRNFCGSDNSKCRHIN